MNLFILHTDPFESAKLHLDKHVVKQILETTQLLATACYVHGIPRPKTNAGTRYRPTHVNHPCAVWVRSGHLQFVYATDVLEALCREFYHRYGHVHSCTKHVRRFRYFADRILLTDWTNPPQCMPVELRNANVTLDDTVAAYRAYYARDKLRMATYRGRDWPNFMQTNVAA